LFITLLNLISLIDMNCRVFRDALYIISLMIIGQFKSTQYSAKSIITIIIDSLNSKTN